MIDELRASVSALPPADRIALVPQHRLSVALLSRPSGDPSVEAAFATSLADRSRTLPRSRVAGRCHAILSFFSPTGRMFRRACESR